MRTACLMMQRDERLLLRPWVLHHGDLFGFENLYIFDNGSADQGVIDTLNDARRRGARIIWHYNQPHDFDRKGGLLGDLILQLKAARSHQMALPLDCDEFIAINTPGAPLLRQPAIHEELARLHQAGRIARTGNALFNVRGKFNEFCLTWHEKCLIPVAAFTGMDHGFHMARIPESETFAQTRFTYLHFHNKPFAHLVEGARRKLQAFGVNVDDPQSVRRYAGTGKHLLKYLSMTAAEYYAGAEPATLKSAALTEWLADQTDMRWIVKAWESR